MAKKKVYIDLGHGGTDPGAVGINKTKEADVVLSVGLKMKPMLLAQGYDVRFSRETNKTLSLSQRSSDANKWGADILVSIHCNASNGKGKGIETFAYKNPNNKLAVTVHNNLLKTGAYTTNRGVKTKNLHMVRETKMTACLTELAFIDNVEDHKILMANIDKYAVGICKGICEYFGDTFKEVKAESKPNESTGLKPIAEGEYNAKLKVTATKLNVRDGRGPKFKEVGSLKKGDVITGWKIEKGTDGNLWVAFRYSTTPSVIGFCSCKYLEPTK